MGKLMWTGDLYRFIPDTFRTDNVLPTGSYTVNYNNAGELLVKPQPLVSDRIVPIPSAEYSLVVREINRFLLPETEARYKELGFIYKRSFMLHGKPGTGKSCLVNRVAQAVLERGGIVITETNHPGMLQRFLSEVRGIEPNRLILVILEEFDATLRNYQESEYLTLLDGQVQIGNVIYMATTNFIERIPARMQRPGRFSRILEVGFPDIDARHAYISATFPTLGTELTQRLSIQTAGLSIDEVREVLQAHLLLGDDVQAVVDSLLKLRGAATNPTDIDDDSEYGEDEPIDITDNTPTNRSLNGGANFVVPLVWGSTSGNKTLQGK